MSKRFFIESNIIDDIRIKFPVLEVKGNTTGKKICITAGIHGCEYPAIEAAIEVYKLIDDKKLIGDVLIIPIVDLISFEKRNMFVNFIDNKNLNRVFPGNINGTYSEKLIYYVYNNYIKNSDIYIDLHGADLIEDIIPFIEIHEASNTEIFEKSLKMAKLYGIKDVVIKNYNDEINDLKQSYSTASEDNIISFLANAGKLMDKGHAKKIHTKGLMNVIEHICDNTESREIFRETNSNEIELYSHPIHVRSRNKGLFYKYVNVNEYVDEGDLIGKIKDYEGKTLDTLVSPVRGKVLLTTNSLLVKEGSLVCELIVNKQDRRNKVSKFVPFR